MAVRVLIVDDHEAIRRGIRALLAQSDDVHVCGEAVDGLQATQMARQLLPDLILMDLSMPKMGGLDATRIIRQELPQTEVIIVTQNDPDVVRRQIAGTGARGYLAKTTLAWDLLPAIIEFMDIRDGRDSADAGATLAGDKDARANHGLNAGPTVASPSPASVVDVGGAGPLPVDTRELRARVDAHIAAAWVSGEAVVPGHDLRIDAEMLAAIVASSDDAIVSKNLDGVITSWNKGAERMFGYTAADAVGQSITLIIPPDRREEETDILARVRRGERVDHFQTVRMRKDGVTLDISVTISPLRNAAGAVIGASKVAREISTQKRAEQALRESEERFRAIVETTPECVKLVAPDGTLLHMNSPGLRMVEARCAEDVLGKNVYDLIAPEDQDRFRAFNEAICGGERGSLEFDVIGLQGSRKHMETHAAPLLNPDGSVVHLAVTRDVTERKRAEVALRASEERLRALVNASSYVVYRMSPDWKEMRRLTGSRLISKTRKSRKDWMRDYIHPGDHQLVQQAIQEAIRTKTTFELEHRVVRPDRSLGWALSRAVPLFDENHEVVEWFGAASDVTLRKQAQEDYRKLAESLETEVRARTREIEERDADVLRQSEQLRQLSWRLLRTQDEERRHIARELHDSAGQVLAVLGMNVSALVDSTKEKSPEIAQAAQEISELVQQLTREIRTTSYLLHPPLLDETGLPAALAWYIRGLAERSGIDISLNISQEFGRLPSTMELVVFRLVQECLTNIHRHSGSSTAAIQVSRDADRVLVEITDHGKGISPEKLAEIQSKGSGVGIRGMRERLRQFDGEMVISSSDSGTIVLVTIPIAADPTIPSLDPTQSLNSQP